MSGIISGNMVGGAAPLRTLIIEDADGNEFTGVVTGSEIVFTANASEDIREGKIAATDAGIVTGSKVIPAYHTSEGYKLIPAGSVCTVKLSEHNAYDYDHLQALICDYNTSMADSVATSKVAIEDHVYEVNSINAISTIIKNADEQTVEFGITNNSSTSYVIRYFTYKEII